MGLSWFKKFTYLFLIPVLLFSFTAFASAQRGAIKKLNKKHIKERKRLKNKQARERRALLRAQHKKKKKKRIRRKRRKVKRAWKSKRRSGKLARKRYIKKALRILAVQEKREILRAKRDYQRKLRLLKRQYSRKLIQIRRKYLRAKRAVLRGKAYRLRYGKRAKKRKRAVVTDEPDEEPIEPTEETITDEGEGDEETPIETQPDVEAETTESEVTEPSE